MMILGRYPVLGYLEPWGMCRVYVEFMAQSLEHVMCSVRERERPVSASEALLIYTHIYTYSHPGVDTP